MAQKNETTALFLAFLITLGLVGAGLWWFTKQTGIRIQTSTQQEQNQSGGATNQTPHDRISVGNKLLIPGNNSSKQAGVAAIAKGDYALAANEFETALAQNRNDPEALIFFNNAQVSISTPKSYSMAVSVPISSDLNGSLEILRGVAQAQNELNRSGGINGVGLRVAIADDNNNPDIAKQIASALVDDAKILGVVGPYASDISLATAPVYQAGELVFISPISTAVKLSGYSPYFFRTVPSDYVAARALSDYVLTRLGQKNAAVFFNSESGYSQSLKSEFVTAIALGGGQTVAEFDLSRSDFSAAKSVKTAKQQGATVLVLVPNTGKLDEALQVIQVNRKQLRLVGGDDVYTPKTLEVGGDAAVDMVLSVPWHIAGNPNSTFPREAQRLWGGDVSWRTALSYDATRALIAALQQNGSRSGVKQALSSPGFTASGASGIIRFLPSGDRNATVQLVKVVPGKRSGSGYDFIPVPR